MARYQVYLLDRFGRAEIRMDHECADDTAATDFGRSLRSDKDVDVWREDRRVARIGKGAKAGKDDERNCGCKPISLPGR
jgi:hypothetical protein